MKRTGRSDKLKDSIMMPPPIARPKSHSDTSEELRKNLIETITNVSENSALQEDIHRFFKEIEEENKKNEDEVSSISSSLLNDKSNTICMNCSIKSPSYSYKANHHNKFNFNL